MRVPALFLVLITVALFTAGCMGGPKDSDESLAAACERQLEEIAEAEDESGTPTAKSTEERLAATTLVECAGQKTKVVAADAEAEGGETPAEGEEPAGEEPAGEAPAGEEPAGEAPAELDPAARTLFAESCGSCHALADAETTGAVGPGLDDTAMDAAAIEQQIINGGGAMPAGLLEGEEATAVAEYVAGAAAAE
jgi:cytochrome c551